LEPKWWIDEPGATTLTKTPHGLDLGGFSILLIVYYVDGGKDYIKMVKIIEVKIWNS
jgi:hypothetical protein